MYYPQDVNSEAPNCGVTAVAIISGKSVADVFAYMKEKFGRGGNWKGRTFQKEVIDTLRDFGFYVKEVYKKPADKRGTQFQKHIFFKRDIPHVVWTTGHVQVVYQGKVYDQTGCFNTSEYWGRRKFITRIVEVK